MHKKILIIATHADDDILSYGGYMIDEIAKGSEVHVRFGTIGGVHKLQNHEVRMAEASNVMSSLGVNDWGVYFHNKDAELDMVSQREIAVKIDADLDELRPDEVFCCYPSTHQDHISLYNAFMISMRLRDGFMPSFVALGEYPFILTSKTLPEGGSFYHPLSEDTLRRKIELFEMYKTQLRPAPSPLGSRGIEVLAQTRGIECGHKYAEKFYLQKLVR